MERKTADGKSQSIPSNVTIIHTQTPHIPPHPTYTLHRRKTTRPKCLCKRKHQKHHTTKQDRGELVLLRYLERWGRDVMRGRADVSVLEPARHCAPFICPCQFVEAHLKCKPRGKSQYWLVCDGLLSAESCNSITFIFYLIFLILGAYTVYMVAYHKNLHDKKV